MWGFVVSETSLWPLSHWSQSGISFPLKEANALVELKIGWFIFLTFLKALFSFLIFLYVVHIIYSFEEQIAEKLKKRS